MNRIETAADGTSAAGAGRRRRIVLHIGSPKCGSTYLQQVMLSNRTRLARRGIGYPHDGGPHPGNAADIAAMRPKDLDRLFPKDIHTVLLSHEDLFSQAPRGDALSALALKSGVEVQLVAFLRPFSEFMFGDYSQFMKQHFDRFVATRQPYDLRGFELFTVERSRTLSPVGYFKSWSRRFPDRPLILESHRRIRPVISSLLDLADDGDPATEAPVDWSVPRDRTNPSLRMQDCDMLADAIRDPNRTERELRAALRDAFHRTGAPDGGRTAQRVAWIEALFERQNDELKREFGYDNRLSATKAPGDIRTDASWTPAGGS